MKPEPPHAPAEIPYVPDIGPLMESLLSSTDKLFFISHCIPGSIATDWSLVKVNVQDSLHHHPSALQDSHFLVDFYTRHPDDAYFNAINQRYWLEYHPVMNNIDPNRKRTTHIIRPSNQSQSYAKAEGLVPLCQCVFLIDSDTYITGPFNFAQANNRQSRDPIGIDQWNIRWSTYCLVTSTLLVTCT